MRPVDPERLAREVGRRIAEVRIARKLTQDELAEEAGVSVKYLQRVEGGQNLTLFSLARFANLLRVRVQDLLRKPRTLSTRRGRPPATGVEKSRKVSRSAPRRRVVRPAK